MRCNEWKTVKLKDIAKIEMGQSPKSEFYNDSEGTPFLQGTRTFQQIYPIIDTYTLKVTKIAEKGDILFSVRAPVGNINIAPVELCIGRGLAGMSSKNNNQKFLYYLLLGNFSLYESRTTGTIFSSINKKSLEELEFTIPNEKEQQKIGKFMWRLDKKIELNNSIISNLEELAQTLFKHWFVDFEFPNENGEPYKSSGGKMVESELGKIPKIFSVKKLSDSVDFLSGGTPKTKVEEYWNGDIPFFTPKDATGNIYVSSTEKRITNLGLENCNSKLYPKNTLFITARGTVGKLNLTNKSMAMNQSCFALRHKDDYQYYLYYLTDTLLREIKQGATGAVFNAINLRDLNTLKVISPTEDLIEQYEDFILSTFKILDEKLKENETLMGLRDTLLPKLLSGEIELPNTMEVTDDVPVS